MDVAITVGIRGATHRCRWWRTRRHRWVAAVVIVGMLSGCSATADNDPGSSGPATATAVSTSPTTPPAVTSTPAQLPATTSGNLNPAGPSTTGTRSSTIEPPGTVVPFRTVVPNSAAGQRIGLVAPTGSDPFSMAVTDSVVTQLRAAGAELISCDPGADPTLAVDCARRLATQQVDGWITVQPGNLGAALCGVGPQGVPLIAIAASINCQTSEVGADDERAGFLAGTELGQHSRTGSGCAYDALVIVTDGSNNTVSSRRTDGIGSGFSTQCPGLPAKQVLVEAGTQDRAYAAFTNVLTTLPDDAEILVAAVDDGAGLGVAAAIPAARAAHITLAAIGADQRARCEIIANPRWLGDTALFPDRYGEVAVPALLDALKGQQIPPRIDIATTFVTADSLSKYYDLHDCPTQ